MANGEVIQEIRDLLAQGDGALPTKVTNRLVLAALVEVNGKIAKVEQLIESKLVTKADLKNERDCLQTGIDNCDKRVDELTGRVNGWSAANTLGAVAAAVMGYLGLNK